MFVGCGGYNKIFMSVALIQVGPLGYFIYIFCNYAHRLRLKKLLYIELYRSSNGHFKPLLDPGGGFTSEAAARRFQN
jgi:hypothetical protein